MWLCGFFGLIFRLYFSLKNTQYLTIFNFLFIKEWHDYSLNLTMLGNGKQQKKLGKKCRNSFFGGRKHFVHRIIFALFSSLQIWSGNELLICFTFFPWHNKKSNICNFVSQVLAWPLTKKCMTYHDKTSWKLYRV